MEMVWAIIIIVLAAADQFTKWLITQNIKPGESINVISSFFYLVNRRNTGAAWSFLADKDWRIIFLAAVSAAVTALLIYVLYRTPFKSLKIALTVLSAGSIGNLIDRVFRGSVTDFLDFHIGSYIFPTFNLADMLIVCSTAFLCIVLLKNHHIIDNPFKHPQLSSENSQADSKEQKNGNDNEAL